jgi:hypothetical protein
MPVPPEPDGRRRAIPHAHSKVSGRPELAKMIEGIYSRIQSVRQIDVENKR